VYCQVKYVYEAMRRLRPGVPVMALHGGMPQLRRVETYNQFVNKQRAVLFATDIAARGLGTGFFKCLKSNKLMNMLGY